MNWRLTIGAAAISIVVLLVALVGSGFLGAMLSQPTSASSNGGVIAVSIQPRPEGPPGPDFVRVPQLPGQRPLKEIDSFIPDPLPPPIAQWFCGQGGNLTVTLGTGRTITYGPCYRPPSIDHLWAEITFVVTDGACAPRCGPGGAAGP